MEKNQLDLDNCKKENVLTKIVWIFLQSMWASDSSISAQMARLQLHNGHPHLCSHTINYNNNRDHHRSQTVHIRCKHQNNNQTANNNNNIKSQQIGTALPKKSLPKSVPSTPLSSKHVSASNYADYENYLFI